MKAILLAALLFLPKISSVFRAFLCYLSQTHWLCTAHYGVTYSLENICVPISQDIDICFIGRRLSLMRMYSMALWDKEAYICKM